jgi:hypothetical protein
VVERRDVGLTAAGVLAGSVRFRLSWPAGPDGEPARPFTLETAGNRWRLDPRLTADLGDRDPFLIDDPLRGAHAELRLEDAERLVWWYPDTEVRAALEPVGDGEQVVVSAQLRIDPATAAAGQPLAAGRYAIWFLGEILGVGRRRRLVLPKAGRTGPVWQVFDRAPIVVRLDWSAPGAKLALEVRDRQDWLAEEIRPLEPRPASDPADLPVACSGRLPEQPVEVTLSIADRPLVAQLVRGADGTALLRLPAGSDLPPGRHTALVAGAFGFLAEVESTGGTLRWAEQSTLAGLLTDPPPRTAAPAPKALPAVRRMLRRLRG